MEGYLSNEARAWIRAVEVAGVLLTPDVSARLERLAEVEAQAAGLPAPVEVPGVAELVASGTPLEKAYAEVERIATAEAKKAEQREDVEKAAELVRTGISRAVREDREGLILSLRPVVAELIEEARPHAATLEPFAPGYSAADVTHRGEPRHLKAFQAAAELERTFGACMAAWRSSYQSDAIYQHPSTQGLREVAPVHCYFANPGAVRDEALAGRKLNRRGYPMAPAPTVLNVAREDAEVGFRLGTTPEILEAGARQQQAEREARQATGRGKTFGARSV
jgi:hypothetical protein